MFWEVSGIGTEVIISRVIYFLDCTLWVTLVISSCYLPALLYLTLLLVQSLVSESGPWLCFCF